MCTRYGIAFYIKENFAKYVFRIRYREAHISFRIKLYPLYVFFGVYIQPEGARYFGPTMFSNLASDLIECHSNGLISYIRGDFNCRIVNLGNFCQYPSLQYTSNVDEKRTNMVEHTLKTYVMHVTFFQ